MSWAPDVRKTLFLSVKMETVPIVLRQLRQEGVLLRLAVRYARDINSIVKNTGGQPKNSFSL